MSTPEVELLGTGTFSLPPKIQGMPKEDPCETLASSGAKLIFVVKVDGFFSSTPKKKT